MANNEKREQVKAYVTKFALTAGVFTVDAEVCHDISSGMIATKSRGMYHGRDWHRTKDCALQRVRDMVTAKRKTIAKQTEALDALDAQLQAGTIKIA
jgi:hypothetical protein